MANQQFKSINTTNTELQLIQSNIASVLNAIQQGPFFNGNVVKGIALTSGQDNQVAHGLNRVPQYFIILDVDTDTTIWRVGWDATHINLHCHTTGYCTIWVT